MLKGFKQFILRGKVIDLAVGVVIGAAFGDVVNSFVANILTPLVTAMIRVPDLSNLYFTVNDSKFMYGNFMNSFASFIIAAATLYFFVVIPINKLVERSNRETPLDPIIKRCPKCMSEINIKAKKCPFCTSDLN